MLLTLSFQVGCARPSLAGVTAAIWRECQPRRVRIAREIRDDEPNPHAPHDHTCSTEGERIALAL
jgi:hypothetical protein